MHTEKLNLLIVNIIWGGRTQTRKRGNRLRGKWFAIYAKFHNAKVKKNFKKTKFFQAFFALN